MATIIGGCDTGGWYQPRAAVSAPWRDEPDIISAMRVYLAAAMTSEDRDTDAVRALRDHVESLGHEIPSRHVAEPTGRQMDSSLSNAQLAARDIAWVVGCDALVAEVSTPSHGVGIEVALASFREIPVLLVYRKGRRVSRLLLGLDGIRAVAYESQSDCASAVAAFLAEFAPGSPG